MEEIPTETDRKNIQVEGDPPPIDGWVSPEVSAALAGEQVEFGKDVSEDEEDTTDNDA